MNNSEVVRAVVTGGTTISKARLLDAVRMTQDRDFCFIQDPVSKYIIVRIKLSK